MLQTIRLSDIKASTPRVRLSQSTEKLQELADSIREEGVIVPIKVRKNGEGYTLVYGHRRVAAAQMAGLKEIDAIVANVPDDKLLTQALTENVIREDMAAIDVAKALQTIKNETGATDEAIGKRLGWSRRTVESYLGMLDPDLDLAKGRARGLGVHDVIEAKAGTGGDLKLAGQVLQKAAKDDLSTRDTRKVAEVVRHAQAFGGQKAVARVLAQSSPEIIRSAGSLPARKHQAKPEIRVVTGKVKFQWLRDPRIILAEEGLKAVSAAVSAIARSEEDKGGGKAILRNLRRSLTNVLKQVDSVLG